MIVLPQKNNSSKVFFPVALLLIFIVNLSSQTYQLGKAQLVRKSPPGLLLSKANFGSPRFFRSVGGVDFHQVAVLDNTLEGAEITFDYEEGNRDGYRLLLNIDGEVYTPFLPDWQLKPIAEFADSEYTSLVSLFGKEIDSENSPIVYHPALVDNLLGLRVLHADILLKNTKEYWQLPADKSGELLGNGEPINLFGNDNLPLSKEEAHQSVADLVNYVFSKNADKESQPNSWVLTDLEEEVVVSISCDSFSISGLPYYYFHETDMKQYINEVGEILMAAENSGVQYDNETGTLLTDIADYHKLCSAYIDSIAVVTTKLDTVINLIEQGGDEQIKYQQIGGRLYRKKVSWESNFREFADDLFDLMQEEESAEMLKKYEVIRQLIYASPVKPRVKLTSDFRYTFPELIQKLNPTVFEATAKTMRYAAFFRYLKINSPEEWEVFIQDIKNVSYQPATIITPEYIVETD